MEAPRERQSLTLKERERRKSAHECTDWHGMGGREKISSFKEFYESDDDTLK